MLCRSHVQARQSINLCKLSIIAGHRNRFSPSNFGGTRAPNCVQQYLDLPFSASRVLSPLIALWSIKLGVWLRNRWPSIGRCLAYNDGRLTINRTHIIFKFYTLFNETIDNSTSMPSVASFWHPIRWVRSTFFIQTIIYNATCNTYGASNNSPFGQVSWITKKIDRGSATWITWPKYVEPV